MHQAIRILITLVVVVVAVVAGVWVWNEYLYSPWTRDGRIRAEVITIAPDVSGWVSELNVKDNEAVRQGDIIFKIDDTRYKAALAQAKARLAHEKHAWELSRHQYQRRQQLRSTRSISTEDLEAARINRELARANYELAQAKLKTEKINLERTTVQAPANGTVINLNLRQGNYVSKGTPVLSLVKKNSFYVTGYFEETKIPLIHVGQKAKIRLMAGGAVLTGRVVSISEAIANPNTTADEQLLPRVQPTFNWVRLAQRIPVDIALDPIPEGVMLSAGMTATITLAEERAGGGDQP